MINKMWDQGLLLHNISEIPNQLEEEDHMNKVHNEFVNYRHTKLNGSVRNQNPQNLLRVLT